jgi:hypothetical protein
MAFPMSSAGPSRLALAAGTLLGMCLATVTPGLLFVAQAIDALHGQSIALAFHVLIAGWGALTGALVVRERFAGGSRRSLLLVPLYVDRSNSAEFWHHTGSVAIVICPAS